MEADLNSGFPHKGDQSMSLNYKTLGIQSKWSC